MVGEEKVNGLLYTQEMVILLSSLVGCVLIPGTMEKDEDQVGQSMIGQLVDIL